MKKQRVDLKVAPYGLKKEVIGSIGICVFSKKPLEPTTRDGDRLSSLQSQEDP